MAMPPHNRPPSHLPSEPPFLSSSSLPSAAAAPPKATNGGIVPTAATEAAKSTSRVSLLHHRPRRRRRLSPPHRNPKALVLCTACLGILCLTFTLFLCFVTIEENHPTWDVVDNTDNIEEEEADGPQLRHSPRRRRALFGGRKLSLSFHLNGGDHNDKQLSLFQSTSSNKRKWHSRPVTVPAHWKRGPFVIFYNVYIPISNIQSEIDNAMDIVKEQIWQIGQSAACRRGDEPLTLYYVLIGNSVALNATYMQQLCSEQCALLQCRLLQEYTSASETATLQRIHHFCIQHSEYRVAYLHSKGSFHISSKNTNWRRLLTAGALSPECINPPNHTCNVCGLQFFTQFTFFIPGNMFTASCDYVRKLLPFENNTYGTARTKAVEEILLLKLRNQLKGTLLWEQRDFMGLDRYSDEHWIGSHPDIMPCDMDRKGDLEDVFRGRLHENEFNWSMGPTNIGICGGINDRLQPVVRNDTDLSRRDVLLLPGLLIKWFTLYGYAPNPSSWVWTFFPDGKFWLEGVQRYGTNAVHVLTDPYRTSFDGSRLTTGFIATNHSPSTTNVTMMTQNRVESWTKENSRRSLAVVSSSSSVNLTTNLTVDTSADSPGYAVFYHIAIPNALDGTLRQGSNENDIVDVIRMQLGIVSGSDAASLYGGTRPLTVFYSIAGQTSNSSNSTTMPNVHTAVSTACAATSNLQCRRMHQFDQNYEGETLRQLHRFCQLYPDHRVSYIHNQPPMQLRMHKINIPLIRHLTMAATSQLCLQPQSNICNVCGLTFYPLWTSQFLGNMFAASCTYVNQLLPPDQFEEQSNLFVRQLLLQRLRARITTELFPSRMDYFGLDRYATEHWIGSHPSLVPCDLSLKKHTVRFWSEMNHSSLVFNWSMSIRQKGAPYDLIKSNERKVLDDEGLLRREYFYIAGRLMKWYALYHEAPAPFSWVWWSLPEGLVWLKGNHDYGSDVVNKLTEEYADDGL